MIPSFFLFFAFTESSSDRPAHRDQSRPDVVFSAVLNRGDNPFRGRTPNFDRIPKKPAAAAANVSRSFPAIFWQENYCALLSGGIANRKNSCF
jgi:hypothetical protein